MLRHPFRFQSNKGWSKHHKRDAYCRRRVKAEWHSRDGRVSCLLRKSERHPRVDNVAEKHAERRAGKHPGVDNVGWKFKNKDEDAGKK